MIRTKLRIALEVTASATTSASVTLNSYSWFTIEVAEADKAKAITIQTPSQITSGWRDVIVLEDVTNAFKHITAEELAVIGPLEEIRLKFASNPAAAGNVYLHATS